jgi:type VI secretion system protein ImpL
VAVPGSAPNIVDERFKSLREFAGAGGDPTKAPVQTVVALFDQLYRFMAVVVSSRGAESQKIREDGQLAVQQARNAAQQRAELPLVQGLLQDAATRSQTIVFRGVQANLNAQWQAEGLPVCRDAIQGRYPIDRNSGTEIQLEDFSRFFGRQGVAKTFFDSYLRDYVDRSSRPWKARSSAAAPVQISDAALRQFERAETITNTFFNGAAATPSVLFDLEPVDMDPAITGFTLDIGGQVLTYSHGPIRRQSVRWPAPESNAVRIEMQPATAGQSMFRDEGPWAWFRLLDRSNMTAGDQPETFKIAFRLGTRTANYELIARSAYNPFLFDELVQFRCPESL